MSFHSIFLSIILFSSSILSAQTYQQKVCDVFDDNTAPSASGIGSFVFDKTYSNSGSSWEIDWDEQLVFNASLTYNNTNNTGQNYVLRLGKGGQVYSFKHSTFGEALPPQWRPSFDVNGNNTTDPGPTNPISSHHGNWAPWNDEVWQLVGSDQKDILSNKVVTKNIHQGGSYMNNYAHRASDLIDAPFYSPNVQSFYNSQDESYTNIIWGQSENPPYVYNVFSDCDVCFQDAFKPSVLFFQRHKNLGDGIIQVDFLIYNYHRTRGIDYWNVPFVGIRNSSLPYAYISNSTTDDTKYQALNSKPGHPAANDPNSYLPEYGAGAVVKTSGTSSASSGWFAFSNQSNGGGGALAFVTSKSTSNPKNGYGDIRYGTAMSNALRDVTIFTRRANGGAADAQTGLKPWGIVNGESIKGRYFIVVDSDISNIVNTISSKNLTSYASIEIVTIDSLPQNNIHYNFVDDGNGNVSANETSQSTASLSVNTKPFKGSYPIYLIKTTNQTVLSSDPYSLSLKPYDGTIKKIELLGFSSVPKQNEQVSIVTNIIDLNSSEIKVYPNPSNDKIYITGGVKNIKIFNALGKEIKHISVEKLNGNNQAIVDVSALSNGVYFIKKDQQIFKIIKN